VTGAAFLSGAGVPRASRSQPIACTERGHGCPPARLPRAAAVA